MSPTIKEVLTSLSTARDLREVIKRSIDSSEAAEVQVKGSDNKEKVISIAFDTYEAHFGIGQTLDGKRVVASLGLIDEQDAKSPTLIISS